MNNKQHKEIILGIIPARKSSKGVPNKNIRPLVGKPLIAYSIEAALNSKMFHRVIVSTDSLKIGRIAKEFGAEAPFLRPKHLSGDTTAMISVLKHTIKFLEQNDKFYPDIIVLLQPTSPLRKAVHIRMALEKFFQSKADSLVSMCEVKDSPYWMERMLKGRVIPFLAGKNKCYNRRQDLPKIYRANGAIYITKRDVIMKENSILGKDSRALIMSQEDSIDIDTEIDFQLAELILKKRLYRR